MDELFLNKKYYDQTLSIEREYMCSRSKYPCSQNAACERYVDYVLSELKRYIMKTYERYPYKFNNLFHRVESEYEYNRNDHFLWLLHQAIDAMEQSMPSLEYLDLSPMCDYREGALVDSVQAYLRDSRDPSIRSFFLTNPNSMAGMTLHFLEWAHERRKLQNIGLRNIPVNVMARYIQEYVWSEYKRRGLTDDEKNEKEEVLYRLFVKREYDDYLAFIPIGTLTNHGTLDEIVHRSFSRTVRYKCTLLAEDDSFQILVRDYWVEMNSYSGNYLDIYYSESELVQKGMSVADKLQIRSKISQYPAIFLWEYAMDNGVCIPVGGLDSKELLELFKIIVDEIVAEHDLDEVARAATAAVTAMIEAQNIANNMEEMFTASLLNACASLQNNENWVRNTNENGRNAYLKDVLTASGYRVKDQTLSGLSPTGKSAGEVDLKIYAADDVPFAIVEALNINADHPCAWNRRYFKKHVNKLYTYDSNGLARNYLVIYATTPEFDRFTWEVNKQIESSGKCPFGEAEFIEISPMDKKDFADLRLSRAKYLRNGREVRLYVICIRMPELPTS